MEMLKRRYLKRYEIMTDEELCSEAQSGDEKAMAILVRRVEKWAFRRAQEWKIEGMELSDLHSVALLETCRAALTYKAGSNAAFKTYAAAVVWKKYANEKRLSARGLRDRTDRTVSYDPLNLQALERKIVDWEPVRSAEEMAVGQIERERLIGELDRKLAERRNSTGLMRRAMKLMAEGAGAESVSVRLNLPIHVARRIRFETEKHLKDMLSCPQPEI